MNVRGGYMRSLFIVLIMFSLFISGCELFEEGQPQFRNVYYREVAVDCSDGECDVMSGGGGGGGSIGSNYLATICENAFYGTCGNPSGEDIYEVHCSATYNLGCSGLCYVAASSEVCGFYDAGLGNCYCVGDGVCDTEYGEPITSEDCAECTPGETQSCSLPQAPGTCGQCNAGLKTCDGEGQWGSCQQVVNPIQEICDNGLDDDCDCNADATDADCVYSHLECVNNECVEVNGQGNDFCSVDLDCQDEELDFVVLESSIGASTYVEPIIEGDYVVFTDWALDRIIVRSLYDSTYNYVPDCSQASFEAGSPSYDVDGDLLLWSRYRVQWNPPGYEGLLIYNMSSGEQTQIVSGIETSRYSIDGDKVVYEKDDDIYMYEISSGVNQKMQFSDEIEAHWPVVSEKGISFMQVHEIPTEGRAIFFYDFATEQVTRVSDYDYDLNPQDMDNGYIVWPVDGDVYVYNINTGDKYLAASNGYLISNWNPKIDGNKVVWWTQFYNAGNRYYNAYVHDISTGETNEIEVSSYDQKQPSVWNGRIVWQTWDSNGNLQIRGLLPEGTVTR